MKDLSKRLFWRCWKQLVKKPKREIRHPLFGSSIAIDRACGRMSREGALDSQWPFWGICKHAPPVFWRKRHLLYWKNGGQTKGLSWRGELVHIGLNWSLMLCKRVAHSPWTSPRWLSPPSYPNPLDWVLTRWFGRELPHFGGVTPTCLRVVVSVVRPSFTIYFYMYFYFIQAGRPKKSFLFGPFFFNITNVFCAKKWVGHACICPRMVTG